MRTKRVTAIYMRTAVAELRLTFRAFIYNGDEVVLLYNETNPISYEQAYLAMIKAAKLLRCPVSSVAL